MEIMPSAQATITWGEGLAAVLTLGIITGLLCVSALVRGGPRRGGQHANVGRQGRGHHRGNRGIGLAAAPRFVAEGAHVFLTGRRPRELEAAANAIGPHVTVRPQGVPYGAPGPGATHRRSP